jgi:hypothetical protein
MNTKVGKSKIVFTLIALLSVAMLILFPYEDASAETGATVEVIKTIPINDYGSYQHFVKICADENNRLERPNVIVSSDIEKYREQLEVNLPPTFCVHQDFIIDAQNPDSITVRVVDSRNF